jgi:sulfide:quinone oxidoreductase
VHKNATPNAKYDGYTSCPLFIGDNKLMLMEFKYGGEAAETFSTQGQTSGKGIFYKLKKDVFPYVYFNFMNKGKWFGKDHFFKPKF